MSSSSDTLPAPGPDLPGLWAAQLGYADQALQLGMASAQEWWSMTWEMQSRLTRALLEQGEQGLRGLLGAFEGLHEQAAVRFDPASEAPVITGDGFGPLMDWMNQAAELAQATQAAFAAQAAAMAPHVAAHGNRSAQAEVGAHPKRAPSHGGRAVKAQRGRPARDVAGG